MEKTEQGGNSLDTADTMNRNDALKALHENSFDQSLTKSESDSVSERDCLKASCNDSLDSKPLAKQIKETLNHFIGHMHEAPLYMQDSAFILTGYRINFHSPRKALKSLFMAHNETINIWSHLLGVVLMVILIILLGASVASNFTNTRLTSGTVEKINEYFDPMYSQISNFTDIDWRSELANKKKDFTSFKTATLEVFEGRVNSIVQEFQEIKKEFNPDDVLLILTQLKLKISSISESYDDVKQSIGNFQINSLQRISTLGQNLKKSLAEFHKAIISTAAQSSYEWLDIYTYFNTHSPSMESRDASDPKRLSRWPILVFLICAIFCLSGSTTFHLFYVLGQKTSRMLQRLDYAGITFLIYGSVFPPVYYGFYCQPMLYQFYLFLLGTPSFIVFVVSMMNFIYTEKYRKMKGLMYGGLGLFTGIPLIQLSYYSMKASPENDYLPFANALPFYILMGASYLGGLSIYIARCPERYNPGKFDLCGHSHQLWHACVILGVVLTYLGAFENYYTRLEIPCLIS